mgnify:CR=1 FL=1
MVGEALQCIRYLTILGKGVCRNVFEAGGFELAVDLLSHSDKSIAGHSLTILSNLIRQIQSACKKIFVEGLVCKVVALTKSNPNPSTTSTGISTLDFLLQRSNQGDVLRIGDIGNKIFL